MKTMSLLTVAALVYFDAALCDYVCQCPERVVATAAAADTALAHVQAAFTARAIAVVSNYPAEPRIVRARVVVLERFAGAPPDTLEIASGSSGTDCGVPLRPSWTYLVYVYADTPKLASGTPHLSLCAGSRPLFRSDPEVTLLRAAAQRAGS